MTTTLSADAALSQIFHEEWGRLVAFLIKFLGDFASSEDVAQDVLLTAVEHWRREGVPANPGAWLMTSARRRAIDRIRREGNYADKLLRLEQPAETEGDDRLRLIFTCCHPALSTEAQIALTLKTVCGLSTEQIGRAFLASEAAVVQRLTRARKKIKEAGIPYRVPPAEELNSRLSQVLAVVYLLFNEGYLTSVDTESQRPDLTVEAEWLASTLSRLMPAEPEVLGLLALIRLHRARVDARFDERGRLVLLRDQDRRKWDRAVIGEATELLVKAGQMGNPGPYQLQAAIVACHAEASSWEQTDWLQIWLLYETLRKYDSSPVVALNRAIALSFVSGPGSALREIDELAADLDRYHLFHATRAEFLRSAGRAEEARASDAEALKLTDNPAERGLLEQRLN